MHLHIHLIPRYADDMEDPRGGVRWIIPNDEVISQLERLASLKDRGLLTDDEFSQQKGKLLSR
jgi:diadenosine tetraphosphate (Ap4A) HIT family hydrolase